MSENDRDRLDAAEVRAREWQHSLPIVRQLDPDSRNIIGMLLRMEDKLDTLSGRIKALEESFRSGPQIKDVCAAAGHDWRGTGTTAGEYCGRCGIRP